MRYCWSTAGLPLRYACRAVGFLLRYCCSAVEALVAQLDTQSLAVGVAVNAVERASDGWTVRHAGGSENFDAVVLALPANSQADLEARCLNGNFLSELPVEMQTSLKPRELHGKLGQGGVPIRLRTVNGGIRVVALHTTV